MMMTTGVFNRGTIRADTLILLANVTFKMVLVIATLAIEITVDSALGVRDWCTVGAGAVIDDADVRLIKMIT